MPDSLDDRVLRAGPQQLDSGVGASFWLYRVCMYVYENSGRTVNAFLEFLPTVGLAMVVNLGRGYPDTVLAEKFLLHCWKPFSLHHLVVQLWYHQVIQERGLSALTNKYKQQIE